MTPGQSRIAVIADWNDVRLKQKNWAQDHDSVTKSFT